MVTRHIASSFQSPANGMTAVKLPLPWSPFTLFPLNVVCFVFCCSDLWLMYPPVSAVTRETTDPNPINTHSASRSPFCLSVSGITSTNIIIGAIVGSILFLALILAVTAWCYKWVSLKLDLRCCIWLWTKWCMISIVYLFIYLNVSFIFFTKLAF